MTKTAPIAVPILVLAAACAETPESPALEHSTARAAARDVSVTSQLLNGSIQSDGLGVYPNGGNVSSILQAVSGDWVLDLTATRGTRKVSIDLTDTLSGNPSPAPFATALVKTRFIAKGSELTPGSFAGMVGLGSTILSPLALGSIAYGGNTYAIRMNSNTHPGTDWIRVTCIGVTNPGSACNKWELTPTGSYGGVSKNVGYLELVGQSSSTFIGLYYFTFDIVVSK